MMDELGHLLAIAEDGSFTAAARRRHLTQPALSAAVRRLEDAFGARLLDRGRHGAQLTAAGAALVPHARAALASVEDARRAVAEVMELRAGQVRLGASSTVATYLVPPVLATFRREHPGVRFVLREAPPAVVMREVARGELDLGMVDSGEAGPAGGAERLPGLTLEPWLEESFVLVGPRGARRAELPLITFQVGTATRAAVDRHLPGVPIVMELGSIAAVKQHVRQGMGMALLSFAAVEVDLRAHRLVRLAHPATPIPRELSLVHRGLGRLTPAAAHLRARLLEVGAGRRPPPRRRAGAGAAPAARLRAPRPA